MGVLISIILSAVVSAIVSSVLTHIRCDIHWKEMDELIEHVLKETAKISSECIDTALKKSGLK